jgi:hypothetical protein
VVADADYAHGQQLRRKQLSSKDQMAVYAARREDCGG